VGISGVAGSFEYFMDVDHSVGEFYHYYAIGLSAIPTCSEHFMESHGAPLIITLNQLKSPQFTDIVRIFYTPIKKL
jgi:hypothetical protein